MNAINLSKPMQLTINKTRFCLEYGAPEAKVASLVVQAKPPLPDPALANLPQHKDQLPSSDCVFARRTGDRDFWNAGKHDRGHRKAGAVGTGELPVVVTLGELEDDEQRSCDKCVILARAIRSYIQFSDRTLRLHFSHRGTKLCCAVEADSGWAIILEISSKDCKSHHRHFDGNTGFL